MQWLIDIIKELVHGQLGYFDRGDPGAWDFEAGDFTMDGAWHELDLGAIVPADAQAVSLAVNLRSTAVQKKFWLRRHGNVNVYSGGHLWTEVANFRIGNVIPVSCDSDRKIDYRAQDNTFDIITVHVNGWWLR